MFFLSNNDTHFVSTTQSFQKNKSRLIKNLLRRLSLLNEGETNFLFWLLPKILPHGNKKFKRKRRQKVLPGQGTPFFFENKNFTYTNNVCFESMTSLNTNTWQNVKFLSWEDKICFSFICQTSRNSLARSNLRRKWKIMATNILERKLQCLHKQSHFEPSYKTL